MYQLKESLHESVLQIYKSESHKHSCWERYIFNLIVSSLFVSSLQQSFTVFWVCILGLNSVQFVKEIFPLWCLQQNKITWREQDTYEEDYFELSRWFSFCDSARKGFHVFTFVSTLFSRHQRKSPIKTTFSGISAFS
jgi:hypothetical protein